MDEKEVPAHVREEAARNERRQELARTWAAAFEKIEEQMLLPPEVRNLPTRERER